MRLWLFLCGILLPIAGFGGAIFGVQASLRPLYQSGQAWAYAGVLLSWPSLSVMLPLVLFCMLCMASYCLWQDSQRVNVVRYGIYTGALLSLVYCGISFVAASYAVLIASAVIGTLSLLLVLPLSSALFHWKKYSLSQLLLVTTVLCVFAAALGYLDWSIKTVQIIGSLGALTLAATPTLNFLAYATAAVAIFRTKHESRGSILVRGATVLAIVVVWYQSWVVAISMMFNQYSRLPTNPNCYISSAAAHGHPWLVGATPGEKQRINLQMCRCKFLEICLATLFPTVHGRIRGAYDVIGPRLATLCRSNVWFADVTYLSLKPIEWIAELLQRALAISSEQLRSLYE